MVEERDIEFFRSVWSRPVVVTYVLFAVNILIFVLMEFAGGTTNPATLLAFGVKSNYEIDQGEVWRFVTPIFIHIGLLHLAFNSYALWLVGPQVEKLYGGPRFLLLYVLTGIGGVVASYWYHPDVPSAGASGAIFGLFGVLLVFGLKYRNSIPSSFRNALSQGMVMTVGINLVIGFMIPQIDLSAHVGGLLAGAALAALIHYEEPGSLPGAGLKILQGALVVVVAASFWQVAAHYEGPEPSFRNLTRNWGQWIGGGGSMDADFASAINTSQQAFAESGVQIRSSTPDFDFVKKDLTNAIDRLNRVPSVNSRADALSSELLAVLQKQYELVQDIERSGGLVFEHNRRLGDNVRRFESWMKEFDDWVDQEGAKYGIRKAR